MHVIVYAGNAMLAALCGKVGRKRWMRVGVFCFAARITLSMTR